ncbi:MAG: methyltransferase domain-containing protein [Anaerolineales bacterium]|nr:methyltransferase domain-containing protein [Anaerolineales bacterium]
MKTLLRFFFRLLYHEFAFTYDLVAATVSFNRWKDWVMSVLPFIEGQRILEIGHGPGHLQRVLLSRGLAAVGIDESAQMGHLAKRNLRRGTFSQSRNDHSSSQSPFSSRHFAYTQTNLTRGVAQHLPFPNKTFDTVVATFPAEYIFDPTTLAEAQRVLVQGGRFVILPGALITGRGALDRLLAWVFRITGETPPNLSEMIRERTREPFAQAGFQVETHEVTVRSSLVFIVLAIKIQTTEEIEHVPKTA